MIYWNELNDKTWNVGKSRTLVIIQWSSIRYIKMPMYEVCGQDGVTCLES